MACRATTRASTASAPKIYNADAVVGGATKAISQTGAGAWDMWNCAYSTQLDRTNALASSTNFTISWLAYGTTDHC